MVFYFNRFVLFKNLKQKILQRSIRRWKRFLLFRFRINQFEMPFSGQRDLLEPLQAWGVSKNPPPPPQIFLQETELQKTFQKN
jgi:hypothetical protein